MTTLTTDPETAEKYMAAILGMLNSIGASEQDAGYSLGLAFYIVCKLTLQMNDADMMNFMQHNLEYWRPYVTLRGESVQEMMEKEDQK